jgi:hypothetical protein
MKTTLAQVINTAAFGWFFAAIVFGGVAIGSYEVAYQLHTQGTALIGALL